MENVYPEEWNIEWCQMDWNHRNIPRVCDEILPHATLAKINR